MTFATTATGDPARRNAKILAASMKQHGWPELIIIADGAVGDFPIIKVESKFWGGRDIKCRFAHFLPNDISGQICFLDADCEATGPYESPAWDQPERSVAGIVAARWLHKEAADPQPPYSDANPETYLFRSLLLSFDSPKTARNVGAEWFRIFRKTFDPVATAHTDELALWHACAGFRRREIRGSFNAPLPNLTHYGRGTWFSKHYPDHIPGATTAPPPPSHRDTPAKRV